MLFYITFATIIITVMKKPLLFIAAAILTISTFTGCDKQTEYANSISATIDTMSFSASGKTVVTLIADTTYYPYVVTVAGQTSLYTPGTAVLPSIKLFVPDAEGTYSIPSQASAQMVTAISGSGGTYAVSGQIVVLSNAKGRLQGNFKFTCANGEVVTNGQYTGIMSFE